MSYMTSLPWYRGKAHKELHFDGHDHVAAYLGNQLVWKKWEGGSFRFVTSGVNEYAGFYVMGMGLIDWGEPGYYSQFNCKEMTLMYVRYPSVAPRTVKVSGCILGLKFGMSPFTTEWLMPTLAAILDPLPETMEDVESFSGFCFGCSELTSVPDYLFKACKRGKNFFSAFADTPKLKQLPPHLIGGCGEDASFESTFTRSGIESVPATLFENCNLAKSFNSCFQGTPLKVIPHGFFDDCTRAEDFTACFATYRIGEMNHLVTVPADLFDKCPNLKKVRGAFYGGNKITSAVPPLWTRSFDESSVWNAYYAYEKCYEFCTSAANYGSIPDLWKDENAWYKKYGSGGYNSDLGYDPWNDPTDSFNRPSEG